MSLERRNSLKHSISEGKRLIAADSDNWTTQFAGDLSYENTFEYLLDGSSLKKIADKWEDKDQVAGLDLMGSGTVFEGLGLAHGLGAALTDARPPAMKQRQAGRIDVAAGNIVQQNSWNSYEKWLNDLGLQDPHFRMIFFRPIGGVKMLPTDPETLFTLFQRAWRLLSSNRGEFFGVVPSEADLLIEDWAQQLKSVPGVDVRKQTLQSIATRNFGLNSRGASLPAPAIRITKNPGAPDVLPMIPFTAHPNAGFRAIYLPKKDPIK